MNKKTVGIIVGVLLFFIVGAIVNFFISGFIPLIIGIAAGMSAFYLISGERPHKNNNKDISGSL
jgi:uncharacterized membrane protein (GlpM family)